MYAAAPRVNVLKLPAHRNLAPLFIHQKMLLSLIHDVYTCTLYTHNYCRERARRSLGARAWDHLGPPPGRRTSAVPICGRSSRGLHHVAPGWTEGHQKGMLSRVLLPLLFALDLCTAWSALPVTRSAVQLRASTVQCMVRAQAAERVLYIDGNNLMAHRKVTKGREELAAKLAGIRPAKATIVFDGRLGEEESETGSNPRVVITQGGSEDGVDRETADDWIERELAGASRDKQIEVVTADRNLRRIAHAAKVKTINPAKFWRRYLNRLKGLKNDCTCAATQTLNWPLPAANPVSSPRVDRRERTKGLRPCDIGGGGEGGGGGDGGRRGGEGGVRCGCT